jgi:metal transporter CNNM
VLLSGLFSGLTLGLLSLDSQALRRQAKHGDKYAAIIYPIRKKGNLLLTTLLLGNVAVNTTLSIYLGSIASGLVAGVTATALIVVFGEIIPQAVISRYALWFGAKTIWFTRVVIWLAFPIAFPIAKILDKALGSELPTTYSHKELMDIISEHEDSDHSSIDADEERIMHGALQFSHRRVREVMTPADRVISFDQNQKLNDTFFELVNDSGYSRLPIYRGDPANIVGILYAKDLIVEDDNISIKDTEEAFETKFLTVKTTDLLDVVLEKMLKTRNHLAIVRSRNRQFVGVVSLEDIFEEIIQQEIVDEDDDPEEALLAQEEAMAAKVV